MNEEQKKKLYEIVDKLEDKVPREVLQEAVDKIANMNEQQLKELMALYEILDYYNVDINLFEKTTDQ
ncbi:hypothetical protein [Bacillus sp. FJAT-22090]|uniref:hypothetical protein n=1 Tax=Bacillus sp. FJAT-22090 TaxID=1581038 RepID=UPI0011A5E2E8|nr:hypothetical protein [Bacillus sp. FJAT-22090]